MHLYLSLLPPAPNQSRNGGCSSPSTVLEWDASKTVFFAES